MNPSEPVSSPAASRLEAAEAAAFRRLLEHLRQREDVANITLMGEAGFCRNCLADWLTEASVATPSPLTREEARDIVYGEPYVEWKKRQPEATPEQIRRMEESIARNARGQGGRNHKLDHQLADSFPASDPPTIVRPR